MAVDTRGVDLVGFASRQVDVVFVSSLIESLVLGKLILHELVGSEVHLVGGRTLGHVGKVGEWPMEVSPLDDLLAALPIELFLVLILVKVESLELVALGLLLDEVHDIHFVEVLVLNASGRYLIVFISHLFAGHVVLADRVADLQCRNVGVLLGLGVVPVVVWDLAP